MTKLNRLYEEQGQSAWLDNLTRTSLRDGSLARFTHSGIRGVTANPTIFAKSIGGSDAYDDQSASLTATGKSVVEAYWDLLISDVQEALKLLRPTFDASGGTDGFVSIEVSPELAHDASGTIEAARNLYERIDQPNVLIKIPATSEGLSAIRKLTGEGLCLNITLIFSLERYNNVIDAYLDGLKELFDKEGDLSTVHSVASFFVSRVDSEVDRRLEAIGTPETLSLRGRAAVAQAKLAYQMFQERFSGERWNALEACGARLQRPLWASTSAKNPAYSPTLYVDSLIGPHTVNTLTANTIEAFESDGTVARTIDSDLDDARFVLGQLRDVGVDMVDVGQALEDQGIAAFHDSFGEVLDSLKKKFVSVRESATRTAEQSSGT